MSLPFIEYTIMVHVPRDGYVAIGDQLAAIMDKSIHFGDYWFHFEIGDVKETPHLQGWVSSNYSEGQWKNTRDNVLRNHLTTNFKKKYSLAVMNFQNHKSYCAKNLNKPMEEKVWTNLSEESIDSLPIYEKHEVPSKKRSGIWLEQTMELLEEKVISKNLANEEQINYEMVETIVSSRLPKAMDQFVYDRNILGVMFHLEQRHQNKYNQRVTRQFRRNFRDKYPEIFYSVV